MKQTDQTNVGRESNTRLDWDSYFMKIALVTAERSTCLRHHIGTVMVRDRRILCGGYNGAPSGHEDCLTLGCLRDQQNIPSGERTEICFTGDTVVKLLNGTYRTMADLATSGSDFWTYSVDIVTGRIVPSLATQPRRVKEVDSVCVVTLDNGARVRCSPDQKFLLRGATYIEARQLHAGDSLFPMYYNFCKNGGYESISNTIRPRIEAGSIRDWRDKWAGRTAQTPTHVLVYEYFHGLIPEGDFLPHHVNGDERCNTPENLELLARGPHTTLHNHGKPREFYEAIGRLGADAQQRLLETDHSFAEKKRLIGSLNMQINWADPDFVARSLVRSTNNGRILAGRTNSDPVCISERAKARILLGISELANRSGATVTADNYEVLRSDFPIRKKLGDPGNVACRTNTILKWFPSLEYAITTSKHINHKVADVRVVSVPRQFLYDVSVPSFENFPIEVGDNSCVFVHNCRAVHSEENAIIQAAVHGISIKGATVYCTHSPCSRCAKMLCNAQISKLIICNDYKDDAFIDLFRDSKIPVVKIAKPSLVITELA